MSRGRRYDSNQKLNMKKVMAVFVVIALIIIFIIGIKKLLNKQEIEQTYFTDISYFSSYTNGKWGVINSKGEEVIVANYDEMVVVPNNKKNVFICVSDVDYSTGAYTSTAIDSSSNKLFTNYSSVEAISNYDSDSNIWYDENALKVSNNGKYGLINFDGSEILACNYNNISAMKGVKNSIIVEKDGLYGLVNSSGDVIIEPEYAEITALTDDYNNGYIVKDSSGNYGVIAKDKTKVLECKYSSIKNVYGNDKYVVKIDGKWNVIDKSGESILTLSNSEVAGINGENYIIINNGKYGVIDASKSDVIKTEYQYMESVYTNYYIVKKDNKFGVVDENGESIVTNEYTSMEYNKDADSIIAKKENDDNYYLLDRSLQVKVTGTNFTVSDGYIRIKCNDEYKFYNLKYEEKSNRDVYTSHSLFVAKNDGSFGIVNAEGTLVSQYQYEDITEQNEYGYMAVKKDGKWGVVDQYGNTVVEPRYEFSDISKISFIGKWHTKEDINTNYFVCE